jgi:hypothetical protein
MGDSVFIIFWLLLITISILLLIKKSSIPKKDSESVNQESEKPATGDQFCESCNEPIQKERLAIAPESVLCTTCQTMTEKKQSVALPEIKTDITSDSEQNFFDLHDDLGDEDKIDNFGLSRESFTQGSISTEDKIGYYGMGLEAYRQGNYIDARKYFQISSSYYHLGLFYENGLGVDQNYKEAVNLYWKASDITDEAAKAQIRLGRMFQDGKGVKKSYSGAIKWYEKAKESCKEYEKTKILNLIAANINDMESEGRPSSHVGPTMPIKNESSSLHSKIKIEIYDKSNYEIDVLSVAAGKTKDLIDDYHIHSCPDYYAYKRTRYITFRQGGTGEMDALYGINKILTIPFDAREDLDALENYGLTGNEIQRLTSYIQRNPFPNNYRYYVLYWAKDLPDKPKPPEVSAKTIYYTLNQLEKKPASKNKLTNRYFLAQPKLFYLKANLLARGTDATLFSDECLSEIYNFISEAVSNSKYDLDHGLDYYMKDAFELIGDHMSEKKLLSEDREFYRILKKYGLVK